MQTIRAATKDEALRQAAAALSRLLERRIPILLLLSAGSAFQILDHINAAQLDQRVTIGMLDERYDTDPNVNNFSQLHATAFAKVAAQRGAYFIDTRVMDGETLEGFAQRLESSWENWVAENPEGSIIATLGLGPDGHTAGIMPYPENKALFKRLFDDVKQWVVGYEATGKNQYPLRATATLQFLRTEVDSAVAYAAGPDKQAALGKALAEEGILAEIPARIWNEMRNLTLFTDLTV